MFLDKRALSKILDSIVEKNVKKAVLLDVLGEVLLLMALIDVYDLQNGEVAVRA